MGRVYLDMGDRLLSNSERIDNGYVFEGEPSPCWEWLGNLDHKGYGRMNVRVDGEHQSLRAHRVSFEWFFGLKLGEGMTIDHKCRVRRCIHPNHLEEVSTAENNRRMRHYWAMRSYEEAKELEAAGIQIAA